MADRCTACHTAIAEQMRDVATVHGSLMHNDPDWAVVIVIRASWSQRTTYSDGRCSLPHEVVGFSLDGHQLTAA
jgi:hypothetical protein